MPFLPTCRLLLKPSWDVLKFKTIEVVFQPTDLMAIRNHLGAEAAQLFHDLINDKSRVAPCQTWAYGTAHKLHLTG
jgi:hypothetical protein